MNSTKIIKHKYEHYVRSDVEACLENIDNINYNIYVVYYINCTCNKNWLTWLYNQLNMVKNMTQNIYVVSTVEKRYEDKFRKIVLRYFPNVNIECYYENEFEYRGIKRIWELGQIHNGRNDILLYFHSKGITRNYSHESNRYDNYNVILNDIELIKEIFTIFPKIDKIGYSSGVIGWLWFNFWYVRGSYINQVEQPIKTTRRHYYEDYISRKVNSESEKYHSEERPITYYENTLESCYCIYTDKVNIKNIGSYYKAEENIYIDY